MPYLEPFCYPLSAPIARSRRLRRTGIRVAVLALLGGALSFTSAAQTYEFRQGIPALLVAPAGSPQAQTSTSALNFGSVATHTTAVRQVLLTNPGTAALTLTASPAVQGDASFDAGTTSCGATLGLGAQCVTEVLFSPTVVGEASGSLRFSTSLAGLPAAVTLAGTAYNPVVLAPTTLPAATLNAVYTPVSFASLLGVLNEQTPELGQVTWAAPSGLPAGMALSNSGVLSGTPTQATAGDSFQVTATYKLNSGQQSYSWTASPGASDPAWLGVSLLLHFDGINGSSIIDETGKVASGTAVTTTATSAIGGSSGDFQSKTLTFAPSSGFAFGTGNFTIETHVSLQNGSNNRYLLDIGANGTYIAYRDGYGYCLGEGGNSYIICTGVETMTMGVFHHIAFSRTGGVLKSFFNGVQKASISYDASLGSSASVLSLGTYGGYSGYELHGKLDELRITKGTGRYTSNFTVPSVKFPSTN